MDKGKGKGYPAVEEVLPSVSVPRAIASGVAGAGVVALGAVNPILGIVAGGLAPFIAEQAGVMMERRAIRLRSELEINNVDFEKIAKSDQRLTDGQIELMREAVTSALGTDYERKVAVIARILRLGLDATSEIDVLVARRYARTVGRIDELEFAVMGVLYRDKSRSGVPLNEIERESGIASQDILRSVLSILNAEGLAKASLAKVERWGLTDFGFRLVSEVSDVLVPGDSASERAEVKTK